MQECDVSRLVATPTMLRLLLRLWEHHGYTGIPRLSHASPRPLSPASLRVVVSSGELLHTSLVRRLRAVLPPTCCILNLYGSTEVRERAGTGKRPVPKGKRGGGGSGHGPREPQLGSAAVLVCSPHVHAHVFFLLYLFVQHTPITV